MWLEFFLFSKRYQKFLKNTLTNSCFEYLLHLTLLIKYSFGLNTLKSTVKTPTVDFTRLKTLWNTKCLFKPLPLSSLLLSLCFWLHISTCHTSMSCSESSHSVTLPLTFYSHTKTSINIMSKQQTTSRFLYEVSLGRKRSGGFLQCGKVRDTRALPQGCKSRFLVSFRVFRMH